VNLPAYLSEPLARSPLVLVAVQINFEEVGREVTHSQARQVQRRIGAEWTQLQSAPLVQATMTPGGAVNQPNRQAYRLFTADSSWSIQLNPDSVTLETSAYVGWSGFHKKFQDLVIAVTEVFDPSTELRLGLRYVDQVRLPDRHDGWAGLVPETLLGISRDPQFADGVLASDQRLLLQLDGEIRCLFRHGLLADDSTGQLGALYLLDYDVYRENRSYDADQIAAGALELHEYVGRLFRASMTNELYGWLKGE